jgi:hypothetical protein
MAAIFNRRAAAHWCVAKGPQVCRGSLGEGRKEERKKLRNIKITLHHGADNFIQNLIFHYFIETEGEREGEETLF